jgi:hypothetical protein
MMVDAKKIDLSSCNLNFSIHSIEVVIILTTLKLLILDFVRIQHLGQVFLVFTQMLQGTVGLKVWPADP